jgi:hypothetical protein
MPFLHRGPPERLLMTVATESPFPGCPLPAVGRDETVSLLMGEAPADVADGNAGVAADHSFCPIIDDRIQIPGDRNHFAPALSAHILGNRSPGESHPHRNPVLWNSSLPDEPDHEFRPYPGEIEADDLVTGHNITDAAVHDANT